MNKNTQCVLFDLNGVLVDTEPINYLTWRVLFSIYDFEFSSDLYNKNIDGKTTLEVAQMYFNDKQRQQSFVERKDLLWEMICDERKITIFEDTIYCLEHLRKKSFKLGVVTSSRKGKRILSGVGLIDYFDAVITGDMVKHGKPAPDIIISALESLHISPQNTILVEDSSGGVSAGLQAGVFVVGIARTNTNNIQKCHASVKSLYELCNSIDAEEKNE